jgi:hypothetical protein
VDVGVGDSLAGCETVVEPDVESIGVVIDEETFADLPDQLPQGPLLRDGKLVDALDMLSGSYESVSFRNGVSVNEGNCYLGLD